MIGAPDQWLMPGQHHYILQSGEILFLSNLNAEYGKSFNSGKYCGYGCGSLSEINYAEELGADIIKIFPGTSVGGPDFIKSVKGPCPWTSLMPTGGVEPTMENLKAWFDAGAVCAGIGSNLITKELTGKKDWAGLTEKVAGHSLNNPNH